MPLSQCTTSIAGSDDDLKVSIIIPALNETAAIEIAIDRAWSAGAAEVIIVDGGSTDDTVEKARTLKCSVLESVRGRGQQLNCGAQHAQGDVLLFLHVDNWLAANTVSQIATVLDDDQIVGGCFRQRLQGDRWIYRIIEQGNIARARYQRLVYGDQGLFVRRDHFFATGSFAEIPLMEDYEFSQRCFGQHRPVILDGPLNVDVRRWEKKGPLRATLQNWKFARDWRSGVDAEELYRRYYR